MDKFFANLFLVYMESSIVVGLITVGLLLFASYLNKRIASRWKFRVWIFLAVWLLIPFGGADVFLRTTVQDVGYETDSSGGMLQPVPQRRIVVELPAQMTEPVAVQLSVGGVRVTVLDIAAIVWVAGMLAFLAVHLISYFHFKRQVRMEGTIIETPDVLRQMAELKQELCIKGSVCAVKVPRANSPMMTGFLKPVLILPKEQYLPEQMYFIMRHELIHLKRRDVSIKLLFMAASAVHWFNPLIWMMQREAVIDMELSCDECVTRGADYAVREAYAEMLLSALCEQSAGKNLFFTRFYSEKKIMKLRFYNILKRSGKKHGLCILLGAVFLTVILGTQIGYSVAKEAEQSPIAASSDAGNPMAAGSVTDMIEKSAAVLASEEEQQERVLENTRMLVFIKEGEPEEKLSELMMGDGYFIYLPEGDWQQSGSDEWTGVINEQVRLWVTHFGNQSAASVNDMIAADGYVVSEYGDLEKLQGEMIYKVRLYESEGDVWGVFYCFPAEAEEGWGTELPVIVDTFGLWSAAENGDM